MAYSPNSLNAGQFTRPDLRLQYRKGARTVIGEVLPSIFFKNQSHFKKGYFKIDCTLRAVQQGRREGS